MAVGYVILYHLQNCALYVTGSVFKTIILILKMQVEFWIDLGLTLLGYIPGIIYAVYVIVR